MVEFALLLLPFLIVTIGIIEIGRAWTVKQAVTNAAREGARILSLPYGPDQQCPDIDCSTADSVRAAALTTTRTFLSNAGVDAEDPPTEITLIRQTLESNGTFTTVPLTGPVTSGDMIGIQVKHQYTSLVQGFISSNSATINLVGVSVMRHE
ncbi:MAG TPA: TadE/TadG family type IV pilus assembly protein [Blastocatellia bacterium]|nr:TadE/TadG family type IV pilus assembly protein [Blastocatellia bacterium]